MHDTPPWIFRPSRLLIGLLCLGATWLALHFVESGITGPQTAGRAVLVAIMIAGIFSGVFFIANGLGFLNSDILAWRSPDRAPTMTMFVGVYIGMMVATGLVTGLGLLFSVHWVRSAFTTAGTIFLLAASGRPWWLLASVRRTGWFAFIDDVRVMRWLLLLIGLFLVFFGVFVPASELASLSK